MTLHVDHVTVRLGGNVVLDVNTRKIWPLNIKVIKKERIKVPAGQFDTVLVEPEMREQGIFISKGKKMEVWVTADERKMPVLMRSEIFIGLVSAELVKEQTTQSRS